MRRYLTVILLLGMGAGHAQTERFKPYKNSDMWSADSLFVGASFMYIPPAKFKFAPPPTPVTVTLKGQEAGWTGELYLMNPSTGLPVYLFNNHNPVGTSVDVSSYFNKFTVPIQVAFMYKVVSTCPWYGCWPIDPSDKLPKYTGPNLALGTYYSGATSDNLGNPNWRFGHRWSVVGKVPGTANLEMGFEDCTQSFSDMDFDDVVFTVTGLEMGVFARTVKNKDFVR